MIQSIICETWWSVTAWQLPVALGYWCLLMMWQRTEAARRILKCIYWDIQSAQIQSNGARLIGRRFIVQINDDPKHTAKATQEFLKVRSGVFCNGRVNLLISTRLSCISLAEDKTKGRKTHKQTTTEVSCSKALEEHQKGETQSLVMSMSSRLKGIPKNENSVIIYSPSSSSKPVWISLFCRTQRKISWSL